MVTPLPALPQPCGSVYAGVCGVRCSPYHVGCKDEDPFVLATGPLWVIQKVGVVLQGIPCITPCKQMAALTHHVLNSGQLAFATQSGQHLAGT